MEWRIITKIWDLNLTAEQHREDNYWKDSELCAVRGYKIMCAEPIDLVASKCEHSVESQK